MLPLVDRLIFLAFFFFLFLVRHLKKILGTKCSCSENKFKFLKSLIARITKGLTLGKANYP